MIPKQHTQHSWKDYPPDGPTSKEQCRIWMNYLNHWKTPSVINPSFVYINRTICWSELWVKYSKIAGLSTSLMWHRGLTLVQSCRMWCALCTLPHSHKSEPHRPINFMLAANLPTPVPRRLGLTQAFLGRSQSGGCGPNVGMKDWRAGGIGVVGSPLIDNNSTKERRGFLEWRRLGKDFKEINWCPLSEDER